MFQSLVVVCCTLEVVYSNIVIPQPPIGNQYQEPLSFSVPINSGYQVNNTYQDGEADPNHKDGKNPYKMFYIEKDQFRCEECDEQGRVRGNMTYVDGKLNAIRTVKYETSDIPLDAKAQDSGVSSAQPGLGGSQDGYQQLSTQGQQLIQQPIIQPQQPLTLLQPQLPYNGMPLQTQGQNYPGSQGVLGPMIQPQNPVVAPQLPVASNLQSPSSLGSSQAPSNYGNIPYQSSLPTNQGLAGVTNTGAYPSTIESLAAEALRNMQPQPVQTPIPTTQPAVPEVQPPQPVQAQVLSDNGFGNLARRLNFINSNGVEDKPQGPWYQQPLFSATSTGVAYNREPNGAYNFEFKTPDVSRKEVADEKNNIIGSYAYRDPSGGTHVVKYGSGAQGLNDREQSIPSAPVAPAVMPLILVPTQQPGVVGQQLPFTLVAAGTSPLTPASNTDAVDKAVPKDDDSKPSDTEATESMLQMLAQRIVANMGSHEKTADRSSATSTTDEEQTTATR